MLSEKMVKCMKDTDCNIKWNFCLLQIYQIIYVWFATDPVLPELLKLDVIRSFFCKHINAMYYVYDQRPFICNAFVAFPSYLFDVFDDSFSTI